VPLQLSEAELHALQQDYPRAAASYEAILKREPRNAIALNNLAWILAADPNKAQQSLELLDRAAREVGLTGELLDTRARARITLKQLKQADRDLTEAMTQEATGLRWFHCAVLQMAQSPPGRAEALQAFREALDRGLDSRTVHPSDLPTYRILEEDARKARK
jgi:tetratricopeptide (TPR) repeat protein